MGYTLNAEFEATLSVELVNKKYGKFIHIFKHLVSI